jgi:glycosyltransferase involved in cell wall biosynthesis
MTLRNQTDVNPRVPAAAFTTVDVAELRRTVLSYKYEVDRLASDYRNLSVKYGRVEGELHRLVNQHNQMVSWLRQSNFWRYANRLLRVVHRLRGQGPYVDKLQTIEFTMKLQPHVPIQSLPQLPSIPALGYETKEIVAEKTWSSARFLKFYYFNELDRILARQPAGKRRIFIQSPIIDWFVPLYQRPQHMALAMARQGYLVFYMTANTLGDRASGFHEVEPNVFITNQPVHLMVDDALISFYSTAATLLSWQGSTMEKVRRRGSKVLYEYIDHIDPEISFHTTGQLARQYALIDDDHVDLVLASATALRKEVAEKVSAAPVAYVPNGVDTGFYHGIIDDDARATVPPALRPVMDAGRPVVGYFGALAPWLWYPVLNDLARMRPDLSFVYIGPDYLNGSRELEALPNVYKLGAVDYALLPYHAQHFDVAIIPFKPGDIAKTTSPLKLFEYFALGKPVVVTNGMLECQQFDDVLVAGSALDYSRRIDQALALAGNPGFIARCRQHAEDNNWDVRAHALAEAHEGLLLEIESGDE